jgi:hypothetical protein
MTSATLTRFRFASSLSHRIVAWSRPSSAQHPSRTKGVTLLRRAFGVVFVQSFKLQILNVSRYIPDAEVAATVEQFLAIGEDPDRFKAFVNARG